MSAFAIFLSARKFKNQFTILNERIDRAYNALNLNVLTQVVLDVRVLARDKQQDREAIQEILYTMKDDLKKLNEAVRTDAHNIPNDVLNGLDILMDIITDQRSDRKASNKREFFVGKINHQDVYIKQTQYFSASPDQMVNRAHFSTFSSDHNFDSPNLYSPFG
jgi:hypothetical protein